VNEESVSSSVDDSPSPSVLPPQQAIRMGESLRYMADVIRTPDEDAPAVGRRSWDVRTIAATLLEFVGRVLSTTGHLREQAPDNWSRWFHYASLTKIIEDGFPVMWVPDAEALAAMIDAPDRPSRQQVLLDSQDRVLLHAAGVLARVTAEDLAPYRAVVEQALGCVTHSPSLAQIGALITAVNYGQVEVGATSLGELFRQCEGAAKGEPLHNAEALQRVLMLTALAPALTHFYPSRSDPVPTWPHRHAVAHLTSAEQFTPGNALESVLLAISVLRQAQESREANYTRGMPRPRAR